MHFEILGAMLEEKIKKIDLALGGGKSLDTKRVNVCLEQFAERIINHPVALYATYAVKRLRHDGHVKMALTILCALVSCVELTLVLDQ
jgi:hypothetical protein